MKIISQTYFYIMDSHYGAELIDQSWYKKGCNYMCELHRDNDLSASISSGGHQEWFVNGFLHREGKPAVIYTTGQFLYIEKGITLQ